MFPIQDLQLLLEFARGKREWSVEVFDAAIRVISYFGRMFITPGQSPVIGADQVRISEDEAIAALDSLTQANADDADAGHPVAGISPALVLAVLRVAIQLLATKG